MYLPKHYSIKDLEKLEDFIQANGFGILFSHDSHEPIASHLPFVLDGGLKHGRLIGHMARSNKQWESADGNQVLVVFQGPHAYISPSWYREQNTVPTWNYATVHIHGIFKALSSNEDGENIVGRVTNHYESFQPNPWTADFTLDYNKQMIRSIVAFQIDVKKVQGKWKMGQNHPPYRRKRAANVLRELPGDNNRLTAQFMDEEIDTGIGTP